MDAFGRRRASHSSSSAQQKQQSTTTTQRKLVIKAFKTAPQIPQNFLETSWTDRLKIALDSIHDQKPCAESYERLYRLVEDLVVGNFGDALYEKLRECLEER
jgi:hypothetical protein